MFKIVTFLYFVELNIQQTIFLQRELSGLQTFLMSVN